MALFEEGGEVNLDHVVRNIIQSTVVDGYINHIMKCQTAKEMWDTIVLISQGTDIR